MVEHGSPPYTPTQRGKVVDRRVGNTRVSGYKGVSWGLRVDVYRAPQTAMETGVQEIGSRISPVQPVGG